MEAILALGLLATLTLAAAGCASGKKHAAPPAFTAPTTTTLSGVKPGDRGSFGAEVPPPGQGGTANADGRSSSGSLQLVWTGGSLHVTRELAHFGAAARPTAAGNKRRATLEAARLLGLVVLPNGAVHLSREPAGDRGFLRQETFSVQGGPPLFGCPPLVGGSRVASDFRSAHHVLLARARLNSGGISTACNPIEFSIHWRTQTPLVGLSFCSRVKRLVGLTTR